MFKYNFLHLLKGIKSNKTNNFDLDNITLIDTSLDTLNLGDYIIMQSCEGIIKDIFDNREFNKVSSHSYDSKMEDLQHSLKILCGTNILYNKMEKQEQWMLPINICSYNSTLLFGVGMNDIDINKKSSLYSKMLMKSLLCNNILHSVRDSITESKLKEMGITNVVNTSCPTMWNLTTDFIKTIPKSKSKNVITTITDYNFNRETEVEMLSILKKEYNKVYIWPSGSHDIDWCLSKCINIDDFFIIDNTLEAYEEFLENNDVDYVGTRLHAGIKALNHKKRTIIIAVDNRAKNISKDTNLLILDRFDIHDKLAKLINSSIEYDIKLPIDNIYKWKKQFNNVK